MPKVNLSLRDFHACVDASSYSQAPWEINRRAPAWSEHISWSSAENKELEHELESNYDGCIQLYGETIVHIILSDCGGDKKATVDVLNQQTDLAVPLGPVFDAGGLDDDLPFTTELQSLSALHPTEPGSICDESEWIRVRLRRRRGHHSTDGRMSSNSMVTHKAVPSQVLKLSQMYYVARRAYFLEARVAWNNGDKKGAGEFSAKGKLYARLARDHHTDYLEMELGAFSRTAPMSNSIFKLDLHHLFEQEALTLLQFTISSLMDLDKPLSIQVITGRGNRSIATNGRGVLLESVSTYFDSLSLSYTIEACGGAVSCQLRV